MWIGCHYFRHAYPGDDDVGDRASDLRADGSSIYTHNFQRHFWRGIQGSDTVKPFSHGLETLCSPWSILKVYIVSWFIKRSQFIRSYPSYPAVKSAHHGG
jgi:hypothetical protein